MLETYFVASLMFILPAAFILVGRYQHRRGVIFASVCFFVATAAALAYELWLDPKMAILLGVLAAWMALELGVGLSLERLLTRAWQLLRGKTG